jgi:antitoxin (DNA-binding transcriptional repressor) of toxin-antitoxin stability system
LVKAAEQGEVIIIERDGGPVAELRPTKEKKEMSEEERRQLVAKTFARMERIWKSMPQVGTDSGRFLEEDQR